MAAGDEARHAELLTYRFEAVSADLQEIKVTMRELAQAVQRLAVVEERQATTNDAVGRAFNEIERVIKVQEGINARITRLEESVNARLTRLELAQPLQAQTTDWVQRVVWLIIAAAVLAVLGVVIIKPAKADPVLPATRITVATGRQ